MSIKSFCIGIVSVFLVLAAVAAVRIAYAQTACSSSYGSVPSAGYGSAVDVFMPSRLLVKALCSSTSATIEVGAGDTSQIVYEKGWHYKNGAWQQISFSGTTRYSIGSSWTQITQPDARTSQSFGKSGHFEIINNFIYALGRDGAVHEWSNPINVSNPLSGGSWSAPVTGVQGTDVFQKGPGGKFYVMGEDGAVRRWDGSDWTQITASGARTSVLNGKSGHFEIINEPTGDFIYALGGDGAVHKWSNPINVSNPLSGGSWSAPVTGVQGTDVFQKGPGGKFYVMGEDGAVRRWDGSDWTQITASGARTSVLNGKSGHFEIISENGGDFIYVLGGNGTVHKWSNPINVSNPLSGGSWSAPVTGLEGTDVFKQGPDGKFYVMSGVGAVRRWDSGAGSSWFTGSASSVIAASAQNAGTNYVVAYVCTNRNGAWKCGCSDAACAVGKWQLQTFESTAGGGGGGGGGQVQLFMDPDGPGSAPPQTGTVQSKLRGDGVGMAVSFGRTGIIANMGAFLGSGMFADLSWNSSASSCTLLEEVTFPGSTASYLYQVSEYFSPVTFRFPNVPGSVSAGNSVKAVIPMLYADATGTLIDSPYETKFTLECGGVKSNTITATFAPADFRKSDNDFTNSSYGGVILYAHMIKGPVVGADIKAATTYPPVQFSDTSGAACVNIGGGSRLTCGLIVLWSSLNATGCAISGLGYPSDYIWGLMNAFGYQNDNNVYPTTSKVLTCRNSTTGTSASDSVTVPFP